MKSYIPLFLKRRDGTGDLGLNHLDAEATIEHWLDTIFPIKVNH